MTPVPDDTALAEQERRRVAAMVSSDVAALDDMLHPDLVFGHTDGHAEDKVMYLDRFRTSVVRYSDPEQHIDGVTISGTTGLVRSRLRLRAEFASGSRQLDVVAMTIWVSQEGSWRLIAHQPTVIGA